MWFQQIKRHFEEYQKLAFTTIEGTQTCIYDNGKQNYIKKISEIAKPIIIIIINPVESDCSPIELPNQI